MCGIIGVIDSKEIQAQQLLESLHHRGPDQQGYWRHQLDDQQLFFGHTRLSIIDLSELGRQPMYAENEALVLIFNGEIYNFQELKNSELKNQNFHSQSDTEVILKLYQKYGDACVSMLRGDFALAICDLRSRKLKLFRDRSGVKPLYYYQQNDFFAFGSEIKALFKAGVPNVLDKEQLNNYFVFKYSPGEHTLIKGIKRLKPGHQLELDLGTKQMKISPYWSLKKSPEINKLSYRDAEAETYRLIEQAVQEQVIADVPVGSFLSGGLDSSIIAHFLRNDPKYTFYCATKSKKDLLKEGSTSDGHYAQLLADKWNLNLKNIAIGSAELKPELIRQTLFYGDDLIADGSQIPSYLICQEVTKDARVILSGMGADELFLGYSGHQLTRLAQYLDRLPAFVGKGLSKSLSKLDQGNGRFLAYRRYLHKFGKAYQQGNHRSAHFSVVGDVQRAERIFSQGQEQTLAFIGSYFDSNADPFDQLFHFEHANFLQKNLNYLDRMAMAHGLEGRVPFLDHRLVEFAYSLPVSYRIGSIGQTKKVLKSSFAPYLPKEIISRRKAGFGMPLRNLLRDPKQIKALLDLSFFASFEGFSVPEIEKTIALHLSGKEDQSALLYALISFQLWYQLHIEVK